MYNLDENDDFDRELIATYEEGNFQNKFDHFLCIPCENKRFFFFKCQNCIQDQACIDQLY